MAGASLLALLDDIATALDDVAVMSKVAAKKTAGVLGDDLALNANQVAGVRASRELPVVWAVAKGSFRNKLILVPAALAMSAFAPWMVFPLMVLGGLYLCYEGFEKVHRKLFHRKEESEGKAEVVEALRSGADMEEFEREKIKGAIRTDFILSAEIIVIALGTVEGAGLLRQSLVVSLIALAMTAGVYGFVALLVKLDDIGEHLIKRGGAGALAAAREAVGGALLSAAPKIMRLLAAAGTLAMFLVGGGILMHHREGAVAAALAPYLGTGLSEFAVPALTDLAAGILAGGLAMLAVGMAGKARAAWSRARGA